MFSMPACSRLFADCPMWLWPVLAWSLLGLGEEIARLEADGTWFEIRLSAWGRAYIQRPPKVPLPTWKDELFRCAMGEPVPDPKPDRPALGIVTDHAQTGWALEQYGRAGDRLGQPGLCAAVSSRIARRLMAGPHDRCHGQRSPVVGGAGTGLHACCLDARAPPDPSAFTRFRAKRPRVRPPETG